MPDYLVISHCDALMSSAVMWGTLDTESLQAGVKKLTRNENNFRIEKNIYRPSLCCVIKGIATW